MTSNKELLDKYDNSQDASIYSGKYQYKVTFIFALVWIDLSLLFLCFTFFLSAPIFKNEDEKDLFCRDFESSNDIKI